MSPKHAISPADIRSLKALLPASKIYTPSDEGYEATILRWSRAAEKPAGLSITPTTPEEVSIIVKYASDHSLDLAVKGGGHSTAGASSTDSGLLIDLSLMNSVRVEGKLIYAQGGCVWGQVDAAAWKHGLATVGGTVSDTGIGGLTLGGGFGHLTGTHGLVIDNVVEMTVVLANGSIVKASKEDNQELMWGLLGAGHNFGVVTEFVYQGYPQSDVFTGMLMFPAIPAMIEKVVAVANDLYTVHETPSGPTSKSGGRCGSFVLMAKAPTPPPNGPLNTVLGVLSVYNGPEQEGREFLKPFFDLGPIVDTMAMQPYTVVNKLAPSPIGKRSSLKGAAYKLPLRTEFVRGVVAHFNKFTEDNPDAAAHSVIAFELYDLVKQNRSDAGCYAGRGWHSNTQLVATWEKAENDAPCRQWARDISDFFAAEMERRLEEEGAGVGGKGAKIYGNYAQTDSKAVEIFGENLQRLQDLKAKYDPGNLFNKMFAIPLEG